MRALVASLLIFVASPALADALHEGDLAVRRAHAVQHPLSQDVYKDGKKARNDQVREARKEGQERYREAKKRVDREVRDARKEGHDHYVEARRVQQDAMRALRRDGLEAYLRVLQDAAQS